MLRRFLVRSAVLCLSAGLVLPLSAATTGTAHADARVTVTNDRGTSLADTTYQTKLTVRGSGFQTIKGGFGGVYLVFGWVKPGGSWRPSNGGITGTDYRYIPDSESSANQGYMKFIAFPGSSTQGEAQAVLSGSGDFQLALTVPGPVFQSVDRDGVTTTVDCRKVTCGVITIGAHGVKNPRNETFTPMKFGQVYDQAPAQAQAQSPAAVDPGAGGNAADPEVETPGNAAADDTSAPTTTSKVKVGKPKVNVDRLTARAGNALAFTASGFQPGEQVLAILDDGAAAMGPMVAGTSGEVAGVLQLPAGLVLGTHELRLAGAASGAKPVERFPVLAAHDAPETTTDSTPADDNSSGTPPSRWFLFLAVILFVLAAGRLAFGLLRRPRTSDPAAAGVL